MIEGKPFAYGAAIGEVAAPFRWAAGTPSGRAIQEAMGRQSAAGMLTRLSRVFPEGAPGRSTLEKLAEAAAIRKQQGT